MGNIKEIEDLFLQTINSYCDLILVYSVSMALLYLLSIIFMIKINRMDLKLAKESFLYQLDRKVKQQEMIIEEQNKRIEEFSTPLPSNNSQETKDLNEYLKLIQEEENLSSTVFDSEFSFENAGYMEYERLESAKKLEAIRDKIERSKKHAAYSKKSIENLKKIMALYGADNRHLKNTNGA